MVNLGTGVGTSVNDIVRELKPLTGFRGEPIHEAARPGEVQRIYLDASRAKSVLGWTPRTPFREGLAKTVEWSRAAGV
jgi:UDP-glucose 4-epimerase